MLFHAAYVLFHTAYLLFYAAHLLFHTAYLLFYAAHLLFHTAYLLFWVLRTKRIGEYDMFQSPSQGNLP